MRKLILIAALALSGCGSHVGVARPSDVYLTCASEPELPIGPYGPAGFVTDEQSAKYMRDLRGAWQDCHSKVDYLRTWFSELPK